eukprot:CAMPEP_0181115548 /NCGR_PEP_ID=MMETSP1071-20121207/21488_1 /TAXON_ID=35127 /ORGANISM="Thalassiosira sp., Strain NH16" /LENGTH=371 /DNA_ID=CAMNT_0023199757 /DNA_START=25 /DNA_END=1140 /DNA_ORIENTATION=+
MVKAIPSTGGAKRNVPEVATPSPGAKLKRARTKATSSPVPMMKTSPLSPLHIAAPKFYSRFTPYAYPSISSTQIKTLKWGNARDLLSPFLSKEEKANIHKKTRADLFKLLEVRIKAGYITPEQFWAVARADKPYTRSPPTAAGAVVQRKLPPQMTPAPGLPPGLSYPRPMPMTGVSRPGARHPGPIPQWHPLPRPQYKYTLRVPPSIWPSTNYPPGIVVGEPIPPSPLAPPSISGTFYSSAILATGPNDKVISEGDVNEQTQFIFATLNAILSQLNATRSDILAMSAHVVDIHKNGEHVLAAHQGYMENEKRECPRSVCAWSMIGVSGLMPAKCVVQLEVKVMVRRGMMTNLITDRPAPRVPLDQAAKSSL